MRTIATVILLLVGLAACGKFALKPTTDRCAPPQQWHTDRCNDRDGTQQTIQQPERDPPAEKAPSPPPK